MAKKIPPPWISWDPDLPVWEFVATNPFKKYGKSDRIFLMHKVVDKCNDWVLVDTMSISAESRVQTFKGGKLQYGYCTTHLYNEQAIAERYARATGADSRFLYNTGGAAPYHHLKGIDKLNCIIRKESVILKAINMHGFVDLFNNHIKPISLYSTWSNDPVEAASRWSQVMYDKLDKQTLGPKLKIAGTMQGIEGLVTDSLTKSVIDML